MEKKTVFIPVSVEQELPSVSDEILISYDGGLTFPESAAFKNERQCMLAGVGGGNGYFGKGFCTNGSTGCDKNLILSDVTHWLKEVELLTITPEELKDYEALKGGGWVSVEERLPEITMYKSSDWVLTFDKSACRIDKAFYSLVTRWQAEHGEEMNVTHWQPLPTPPSTNH